MRIIGGLLLVLIISVAAFAFTFRAAVLDVTAIAVEALPAAHPPAEMSISSLPTGQMKSRAALAFRGGSFGEERDFSMDAILVRHPRGNLLIDAGFGRDVDQHVKTLPKMMQALSTYSGGTAAGEQLRAGGLEPSTLAGVVLTHAHWDHVSGLDSLPGVKVWVNDAERQFIANDEKAGLLRSLAGISYQLYEFEGGPYLGFPRSHDVWGDGSVVLVPAPGHTPGSIVVFLNLPSGTRYALLGDLVWQMEGVELPAERPWLARRLVGEEDSLVRENIQRVAAIHRRFPEMRMVPAHDARIAATLPRFPAAAH